MDGPQPWCRNPHPLLQGDVPQPVAVTCPRGREPSTPLLPVGAAASPVGLWMPRVSRASSAGGASGTLPPHAQARAPSLCSPHERPGEGWGGLGGAAVTFPGGSTQEGPKPPYRLPQHCGFLAAGAMAAVAQGAAGLSSPGPCCGGCGGSLTPGAAAAAAPLQQRSRKEPDPRGWEVPHRCRCLASSASRGTVQGKVLLRRPCCAPGKRPLIRAWLCPEPEWSHGLAPRVHGPARPYPACPSPTQPLGCPRGQTLPVRPLLSCPGALNPHPAFGG